jgi:hypothetical protein
MKRGDESDRQTDRQTHPGSGPCQENSGLGQRKKGKRRKKRPE